MTTIKICSPMLQARRLSIEIGAAAVAKTVPPDPDAVGC
jgi:hypothetical protein